MSNVAVSDVISYARVLAKTDSNGLTNANGISFTNDAIFDLRRKFTETRKDLFIQESERSITSVEIVGGSQPGKFLFPSDMWLLKNIQVNLTDVNNPSLYVEAAQVDSSNLQGNTSWEYLKKNQPSDQPIFDYRGDWFEIAPTPTTTGEDAIKIFYFLAPTEVASVTDTFSFPETLDYRILAKKVASTYLQTLGNEQWVMWDKAYNSDVQAFVEVIGAGEQAPVRTQGIKISGWEF